MANDTRAGVTIVFALNLVGHAAFTIPRICSKVKPFAA